MMPSNKFATVDGRLKVYSGKSRSGKTAKCVRDVRGFKTVFVWDAQGQWASLKGYTKITSINDLIKICIAGKKGKYAYVPNEAKRKVEFDKFCKAVYHYGQFFGECAVVAEELTNVTSISKSDGWWGDLCRGALKFGLSIFAIAQRWQEADKTAMGNATDFYVFQTGTPQDAKYIADRTRIEYGRINSLKKLEFLHYDTDTFIVTGGKLTF